MQTFLSTLGLFLTYLFFGLGVFNLIATIRKQNKECAPSFILVLLLWPISLIVSALPEIGDDY